MDARKVLEMGGGTLLISLPKDWTRKNGVSKGSTVAVDVISARKLMVRPIEDAAELPREASIPYPAEDFAEIVNDVTGAYLLGFDSISVQGTKVIRREDRERLKTTMAKLIGLEIMDEDAKHLTMQFLLEKDSIDPVRIVRRMSGIVEGMIKDTAEGLSKPDSRILSLVAERDDEVDRLYFLLVRTIRTATARPETAERYGLSPVDILDFRVVASYMESVGDAVAELSKTVETHSRRATARQFAGCLTTLNEMEDNAIRLFLNREGGRSQGLHSKIRDLSVSVSDKLGAIADLEEAKGTPSIEALASVERISRLLVDISDLAVPTKALS